MLPGLAALIAVIFTYASVQATENQVQIARQGQTTAEQGQITDRYNAAITNLGSRSIDVRLGGIYALQRLMKDSHRDQPTIIAVLCAFVRDGTMPTPKPQTIRPPTDIQAALTVVGGPRTAKNSGWIVIDLDRTQLARARLFGANLGGANFTAADLTDAEFARADLRGAGLRRAGLSRADLYRTDLIGANLIGANLIRADLRGADLAGANLIGANLYRADLTDADLTRADLTAANLTDVNLYRADLAGADLSGAVWPADAAVPKGWVRDTQFGRLKRLGT